MQNLIEYTINGVCYVQAPVVIAQILDISKTVAGMDTDFEDLQAFITAAGDRLPQLLAIVLTEKAAYLNDPIKALQGKDVAALTATFRYAADMETTEKVVADFFTCNPVSRVLQRIDQGSGMLGMILGRIASRMMLSSYASSLQEGISQSESKSAGGTASQS